MKKTLLIIALVLTACGAKYPFDIAHEGDVVFYGDSITAFCAEYTDGINRAIPGLSSSELLPMVSYYSYLDSGASYYILIGTNDINKNSLGHYIYNVASMFNLLWGNDVTIISILPTGYADRNAQIKEFNAEIKRMSVKYGYTYMDIYDSFVDSDGLLADEYNADNVHLTNSGCEKLYIAN